MASNASVQLRLNSTIYRKGAILATQEAFEDFAELRLTKEGASAHWLLDVSSRSDDFDATTLAREVGNFILAETMHVRREEKE